MNHYLVIAHRTATDPELVRTLTALAAADPYSAFTLLVTTTHPIYQERSARHEAEAQANAEAARALLEAADLHPVRVAVGAGSILSAAQDELIANPELYHAVLLHTRAPHLVTRLAGDVRRNLEARSGLPVFHAHRKRPEPWRGEREPAPGVVGRLWRRTRLEQRVTVDELLAGPRPPNRREMIPILLLMCVYLAGGLTLALTVNRRFYLNDIVAIIVYCIVLGGLLLAMRADRD